MALDILNMLAGLKPHYRGAIFLTYTLDLVFFEELVAPKLDALGCTNVVILADQHGYDEALARGSRHLHRVGRQYVCAPIVNSGDGVQHAKAILLVGPEHGLLLVGSGNLTLHGIGRNLEQFIQFELDFSDPDTSLSTRYPFAVVWQLVDKLANRIKVASTVTDRLKAIGELATWLSEPVSTPDDLRIWHSMDRAIISQWGDRLPVEELRLLSPFWSLNAIETLVNRFHPQKLILGLNANESRLNGLKLQQNAKGWNCDLQLFAIAGQIDEQRRLHAKTFVGQNQNNTWCIVGSANCTSHGLLNSWPNGGNLELIVWQRANSPEAFKDIWSDRQLTITSLNPADIQADVSDEPKSKSYPVRLRELRFEKNQLTGHIIWENAKNGCAGVWWIELQRVQQRFTIIPDDEGWFMLELADQIKGSEAGRVICKETERPEIVSPFHWIDQPAELLRFGNRTYHARVQASLQTFAGAGNLFEELMNFLWERVDPRQVAAEAEDEKDSRPTRRKVGTKGDDTEGEEPPPPPSAFITDEELTDKLMWHVEGYTPHNRSVSTLRDLLSLALLRLTTETKTPEPDVNEQDERDEDADADRDKQLRQERKEVLQRLCDYVHRYCRRYANRLVDVNFLSRIGPRLLFENHYTLGRILLEFYEKVQIFADQDLRRCLLSIFGALFWPEAAGLSGKGGWKTLLEVSFKSDQLQSAWQDANMPILTMLLVTKAWGKPLSWQQTQYRTSLVQRYMLARELVNRIEDKTGKRFWETAVSVSDDSRDLFGFRLLSDLTKEISVVSFDSFKSVICDVADYQTPAEEKFKYLFMWWRDVQRGSLDVSSMTQVFSDFETIGIGKEAIIVKQLGKNGEVKKVKGEEECCPKCFVRLPAEFLRGLRRYELKICPMCHHTALYWEPTLNMDSI